MESSVLSSSDIDGVYNGAKDDVDAGVATLMQLDGYKLSDTEKKKDYVEILLKKYQDNGTISELVCDKENVRYTFTYNEGELKGALGGIYFGDFDQ